MSVEFNNRTFETYIYKGNKCLYLREAGIEGLDEIKGLETISDLDVLNLSFNKFEEIRGLAQFKNLTYLNLRGNSIKDMSDVHDLEKLKALKTLNLSENQIHTIRALDQLNELRELELSYNYIKVISGVSNNKNLKTLNLSNNRIRYIEHLENLTSLKSLNLAYNNIYEIAGLEALTRLEELNLEGNKIMKLKGLNNLANLQYINLLKNENIAKIRKILGERDERGYAPIGFTPLHYVRYCNVKDILASEDSIQPFLSELFEEYKNIGFGDLIGSDNVWWWILQVGFDCMEQNKILEAKQISKFLMEFGIEKHNAKAKYCAQDLFACALSFSDKMEDLLHARSLFEENKEKFEAWIDYYFSMSYYEDLLKKLDTLSKRSQEFYL